jgi:septal ring factor EnvC (AmiA/AmiB activator)
VTEKEVRELTAAQREAREGLRQAVLLAFEGHRADLAGPADRSCPERARHLMRRYLGADLENVERLALERQRKERELSGIERQVEISERKMARERKEGEKLLSRHEAERKRLSDIGKEKKRMQRELRALPARIARMESLVARVERLAKERERIRRKKALEAARKGAKPPEAAEAPRQFASLAGGMAPPMPGRSSAASVGSTTPCST